MEQLREGFSENSKGRAASFDDHRHSAHSCQKSTHRINSPSSLKARKVPRLIHLHSFSVSAKDEAPTPPDTPVFSLSRPFPLKDKAARRRRSLNRDTACPMNNIHSPSLMNLRLSATSKPREQRNEVINIPVEHDNRLLPFESIPKGQYLIATPELLRTFVLEAQASAWAKDARASRGSVIKAFDTEHDQEYNVGGEMGSSTLVTNEKEKLPASTRTSCYAPDPHYMTDDGEHVKRVFYDFDVEKPQEKSFYRRMKKKLREPAAEALGKSYFSLLVALTANANVSLSTKGSYVSECFGSGIGLMIGIYVAGGISGGHINPIVSITLAIFRGFPWKKVIPFCVAQVVGGLLGSLIVHTIYSGALDLYEGSPGLRSFNGPSATAEIFFTTSADYMSYTTAFLSEFLVATILLLVMMAIGDRRNSPPPDGLNPIVLMWVLIGISFSLGSQTSYALNPALDLAARLIASVCGYHNANWTYKSQYWLWATCMANLSGALFGAFLYDFFIYEGPDSPLNRFGSSDNQIQDGCGNKLMNCITNRKKEKQEKINTDNYV
ncbi:aquaporin-like protein [Phakopsora pachyrhizi]|uniref:Aquaporin-like protein n=1 Tax=Phakopsora pachyrhizi TaxID=170000 RepID=A0AAV0AZQ3_PHAPC|nr:aquaporin-like protein [Phakopsora pachyrhizi]CAH7675232.1 aquaporin-like protein [Phakopsora pachyrhizi]